MNIKYTKEQIQQAVSESETISQALRKLGLNVNGGGNHKQFNINVKKFGIDISHFKGTSYIKGRLFKERWLDPERYFSGEQKISSNELRLTLFKQGLKEKKCECCSLTEWNGQPAPLQLHHKDGDPKNNAFNNLQILCANCHAQTDTFCKSWRKTKKKTPL